MLMPIHGYPSDYWRFTPEGLRMLLKGFDHVDVAAMGDPTIPFWVFGVAVRGRPLELRLAELPSLVASQERLRAGARAAAAGTVSVLADAARRASSGPSCRGRCASGPGYGWEGRAERDQADRPAAAARPPQRAAVPALVRARDRLGPLRRHAGRAAWSIRRR